MTDNNLNLLGDDAVIELAIALSLQDQENDNDDEDDEDEDGDDADFEDDTDGPLPDELDDSILQEESQLMSKRTFYFSFIFIGSSSVLRIIAEGCFTSKVGVRDTFHVSYKKHKTTLS